ncbi:hypothetical protein V2G26_007113 [Clonostachys chloroleuca]
MITHKRAKDREAQRAIRARTKEHIEQLEREVAELTSKQSRDQTIQDLLRHNKALGKELIQLREFVTVPMTSSRYSAPFHDGSLGAGNDASPSLRGPPSPSAYQSLPVSRQHVPLTDDYESLANTISRTIPSNVSIPSSADYSASCLPISVPNLTLPPNTSSSSLDTVPDKGVTKIEYNEVRHHGTMPEELRLPYVRHGEEASHTQYLGAVFRLSDPPLHPGIPYSHPCTRIRPAASHEALYSE